MEFDVTASSFPIPVVYETYSKHLPVIVMVTQGYQGNVFDGSFEKGQVLRLHAPVNVKRVSVRLRDLPNTQAEESYSLPFNHPLKFQTFNWRRKAGHKYTLEEIIQKNKFPVDVQFAENQTLKFGQTTIDTKLAPKLILDGVYTESHLLANVLNAGIIDLRPITIPLNLWQLRVATVTGIKAKNEEQWSAYQQDLTRKLEKAAATFDFDMNPHEVSIYSSLTSYREVHIYESLQPEGWVVENPDSAEQDDELYEDIEIPQDGMNSETFPDKGVEHFFYTGNVGQTQINVPYIASTDTFVPPTQSVPARLQPIPRDQYDSKSRPLHLRSSGESDSASVSHGRSMPKPHTSTRPVSVHYENIRKGQPVRQPYPARHLIKGTSPTLDEKLNTTPANIETSPDFVPPLPPREKSVTSYQLLRNSDAEEYRDSVFHSYENNIQRATVSPLLTRRKPNSLNTETAEDKTQTKNEPTQCHDTDKQIPDKGDSDESVSMLKINEMPMTEISRYMKILKLEKHILKFEEQLVDGEVLSQFNTQILKDEFSFTTVEAIRMMSFIKNGHVPNYG